ncbi:MAG TPA: nucleotidyl transferase AbiEii/AbiGii toxin family protein [Kribbella sp.]
MNRISRGTPAGDAYLDLKNQAQRTGRTTQELLQLYVLEGFLARLAASPVRDNFVLKGGVLLAAFDTRRATKDVDLAGRNLPNSPGQKIGPIDRIVSDSRTVTIEANGLFVTFDRAF